jgi:hypothetical protein
MALMADGDCDCQRKYVSPRPRLYVLLTYSIFARALSIVAIFLCIRLRRCAFERENPAHSTTLNPMSSPQFLSPKNWLWSPQSSNGEVSFYNECDAVGVPSACRDFVHGLKVSVCRERPCRSKSVRGGYLPFSKHFLR